MTALRYLYLCRHGQSQWNAQGLLQGQVNNDLSDLGTQQATQLASQASQWNIHSLYHSPLSRAQQTAQICGQLLGLSEQPIEGSEERHFGSWQGKHINALADYQKFKQHCYQQRNTRPDSQGESTEQVQNRMQHAIQQIARQMNAKNIKGNAMLISHGDAIDCLLSLWAQPQHLENCQSVRLVLNGNDFVWQQSNTSVVDGIITPLLKATSRVN